MHHLAIVAVVLGVELAGGLSDVVRRELWKLVCYWRVHSVKADFQSGSGPRSLRKGAIVFRVSEVGYRVRAL